MRQVAADPQAWGIAPEYTKSPDIKEATEQVISPMQVPL